MGSKTKIVVLHMKEIIYTVIFAVLAIVLILLLVFMFLPADKETSGTVNQYDPGVYTSSLSLNNTNLEVEVTVDEYSLYATYASADDEFEMYVYAYSSDDVYYNMTEDGTLTAIEGRVVEMSMYGDNVGSATVRGNGGEVTFYFSGVDMATAEAVMEGLL